jgi:hypothetical protein
VAQSRPTGLDSRRMDYFDRPRPPIPGNRSVPFLMTEENTEVFAWYGQAVAIAQFLEDALVDTLTALQPRTELARSSPEKIRQDLSKANLGRLQREMARHPEFRNAALNLMPLNALRVELVHHWWTNPERQAKLTTEAGRAELVTELKRTSKRIGPSSSVNFALAMLAGLPRPTSEKDAVGDDPRSH